MLRSRQRDVQLTVSEHRVSKINANNVKCLSLRFIDGHGEGERDQKLQSTEFERYIEVCRNQFDARN